MLSWKSSANLGGSFFPLDNPHIQSNELYFTVFVGVAARTSNGNICKHRDE
jgi:hypothetical protein